MTKTSPSPFSTPKRKRTAPVNNHQDAAPASPPPNSQFSFNLGAGADATPPMSTGSPAPAPASGSSSPRSGVAHRFRGLALSEYTGYNEKGAATASNDGGPRQGAAGPSTAATTTDMMEIDEDESKMRKRTRLSPMSDASFAAPTRPLTAGQAEFPETHNAEQNYQPYAAVDPISQAPRFILVSNSHHNPYSHQNPNPATSYAIDQAVVTSSPKPSPAKLSRSLTPSASSRTLEALKTGARNRRRAGTPPLGDAINTTMSRKSGNSAAHPSGTTDPPGDAAIVDPVRAALTWHEDEITIYDPEDEDDDGVGINGIGFKPTPAIAYARTMKRRQQLAEYKKREEREARARRSLRRRGGSPAPTHRGHALQQPQQQHPQQQHQQQQLEPEPVVDGTGRRVRFTETEPSVMIETV